MTMPTIIAIIAIAFKTCRQFDHLHRKSKKEKEPQPTKKAQPTTSKQKLEKLLSQKDSLDETTQVMIINELKTEKSDRNYIELTHKIRKNHESKSKEASIKKVKKKRKGSCLKGIGFVPLKNCLLFCFPHRVD